MFGKFNENEIQEAESNICRHIIKDYNIRGKLNSGYRVLNMPTDLNGAVFYQTKFESSIWNKCDLTNASGNGTIFRDNDFEQSKLDNVSMQYCSFTKDVFHECTFHGSNFANSTFTYCAIQNSDIYGCSFLGTEFHSGILRDTQISSSTFELCKFRKIIMENLDLRQLTLNYAFFEDVTMKNVCLPFFQMPYTFNGLQYIFDTSSDITIASHDRSVDRIELSEYRNMLTDFIIFFDCKNEYFPLTNCYIVNNQRNLAILCNETGIKTSTHNHDFRSLYFYCVQAAQILKLPREKRTLIYSQINTVLANAQLTVGEYHQFYLYFPRIKKLLFDTPNDNPVLTLTIHTNIAPDDYRRLSILLKVIEDASAECGVPLDSKHIEIRHNSPNIIDFFTSGELQNLVLTLQHVYTVLSTAISDISNIITIGSLVAVVADKGLKKMAKRNVHEKIEKEDNLEIVKLRKELNQLIEYETERSMQSVSYYSNPKIDLETKLASSKQLLKAEGIEIASLEIQFLDGKEDILDTLYHQDISLTF